MPSVPATTIRIDPETKRKSAEVFDEIGMSTSSAINAFLKAVIREGGLPFELKMKSDETMKNTARNTDLNNAYDSRKDEFYTVYEDVEAELVNYTKNFKGKKIYCNSDNPFESAFFKFFVLNFREFELESLTATSYSNKKGLSKSNNNKEATGAYKAVVTTIPAKSISHENAFIDFERLFAAKGNSLSRLKGDGDFRSEECKAILADSDVVVTNPPFSIFREYITQLVDFGKEFLILGNMNATTYKEVFPKFQSGKIRYGVTIRSGDRKFYVPDDYPMNASVCGIDGTGRSFIRVKGVRWFTNLPTKSKVKRLDLKRKYIDLNYEKFENYNAIEVSKTADIPIDYKGIMAVPITFLDKYCPEQFEILMLANGNARRSVSRKTLSLVGYSPHPEDKGGVGVLNGKRSYVRVLIRRKI